MPRTNRPQRPSPEAALLQLQGQCIPFGSVSCPHTERRPTSSVLGGSSWSRCPFKAQRPPFPPGRRAVPRGTNPSQSTEGFLQGASPSPAGRHMGDREGPSLLLLPSTRFSPQPAHCPPCRPQWEHAAHHLTTSCLRWSLRPQSRKWGARGGGRRRREGAEVVQGPALGLNIWRRGCWLQPVSSLWAALQNSLQVGDKTP